MNYIDQITVGSTTYDIQDSNAQRKILEGEGAPTTSTVGTLGQHYYNTSATQPPYEYVCVGISGSTYTWLPFGMTILKYGASGAWAQFLAAYNAHEIVYCRASSNANPASGSQTRLAFMAYVNNETNPTSVEFQYYRSVSSHNATQQGDQVYVYKLASSGTWSVEVREAYTKIAVGTGLSSAYSSGTLTLSNSQIPLPTVDSTDNGKVLTVESGAWAAAEIDALPSVTSSDNGKVLGVNDGVWSVIEQSSSSGLPSVTIDDNGKVLEVVSGVWSAAELDALPSVTVSDNGKVLAVASGAWAASSIHQIPSGGTQGQILKKSSATDYDVAWSNETTPPVTSVDGKTGAVTILPIGGTTGQVLTKSSNSDYAAIWTNMDALPAVTSADDGKVLSVASGEWSALEVDVLPTVTSSDNGKFLGVVSGAWTVTEENTEVYYGSATPPSGKTIWVDPSGSADGATIPSAGASGQILGKLSNIDYDIGWVTATDSSKVSNSGDIMTGTLQIRSSNIQDGTQSEVYGNSELALYDVNGIRFGYFLPMAINGAQGILFSSTRNIGTSVEPNNIYHGVSLYIDDEGECSVFFNYPNAWRTALNAVNKSGDTITGIFTTEGNPIYAKSTNITKNTSVSAGTSGNSRLYFTDSNGSVIGWIQPHFHTNNREGIRIAANRIINDVEYTHAMAFYIDDNGNKSVNFSNNSDTAMLAALGLTTTTSNTISEILTAASTSITITEASYAQNGKIAQLYFKWTSSEDISVPASGNISNINVATLVSSKIPIIMTAGYSYGDGAGAARYYISATNGTITLCACEGTGAARTITAGSSFSCMATYILP